MRTSALTYLYGNLGSNACPAGSTQITDSAACQSATAAQGKAWGAKRVVVS
jgi:hypothetical protein